MDFAEYDTRLAAYAAIVDENDRILLTNWTGEGLTDSAWTMPGGGVEFDETVPEAIVREVHEESGYHVELGELLLVDTLQVREGTKNGRPLKGVRVVHRATIVGGELGVVEVDGTTDDARWFTIEEAREVRHVSLVDAVLDALGH